MLLCKRRALGKAVRFIITSEFITGRNGKIHFFDINVAAALLCEAPHGYGLRHVLIARRTRVGRF